MTGPLGQPDPATTPESAGVGLIAGNGRLPILVAEGIHRAGKEVRAIGLAGYYDPSLESRCDDFKAVGLARIGQWIRTLRAFGVREAVMVGGVSHTLKYERLQFLRYVPDWRAMRLWYQYLVKDRRTNTMLGTLADTLEEAGITLIDNRVYIPDHLAIPGVMTRRTPSPAIQRDIDFGWPLLERMVELGIGQALAVRGCDVIAVEAAEGTDAMIHRAGALTRRRPWVLFKTCGENQDMRADVATIGTQTIENLHKAGAKAIVLGADRVIMIDKDDVLELADKLGIAVVGVGRPETITA